MKTFLCLAVILCGFLGRDSFACPYPNKFEDDLPAPRFWVESWHNPRPPRWHCQQPPTIVTITIVDQSIKREPAVLASRLDPFLDILLTMLGLATVALTVRLTVVRFRKFKAWLQSPECKRLLLSELKRRRHRFSQLIDRLEAELDRRDGGPFR